MKKIILLFIGAFLFVNVSYGQAVDDRTIIPVAVTLQSILRLNVVSGGNIEFNFNTLADYQNGIENSAEYNTRFTVASSVDWNVMIHAEDGDLTSTDDDGTNAMDLGNIGISIDTELDLTDWEVISEAVGTPAVLPATPTILVGAGTANNAGDITDNDFTINWQCATTAIQTVSGLGSMLNQDVAANRYATNVFLILEPAE